MIEHGTKRKWKMLKENIIDHKVQNNRTLVSLNFVVVLCSSSNLHMMGKQTQRKSETTKNRPWHKKCWACHKFQP